MRRAAQRPPAQAPHVIVQARIASWCGVLAVFLAGFCQCADVGAQTLPARDALVDSVQRLAQQGFVHDDVASYDSARALAERGLAESPNDALLLHCLGYIDFRVAVLLLQSPGGADSARAAIRARLDRAEELLTRSAQQEPLSESYALLSAIYGIRLAVSSKWSALGLLRRSHGAMNRALALDSLNPRVHLIKGINAAQTPGLFGGGSGQARAELERAIALFASDRSRPPYPTWGLGEAYAWLGVILTREGELRAARAAYEKALSVEPESQRVRNVLLPRLERRERAAAER